MRNLNFEFKIQIIWTILTFSHLVHIVQYLSKEKTKYINNGDMSSYSEYYLPCITIYQVLQHKPLNLMNKPYVYSRFKLNDISQNNNNNLKCTKPYEKISYRIRVSLK